MQLVMKISTLEEDIKKLNYDKSRLENEKQESELENQQLKHGYSEIKKKNDTLELLLKDSIEREKQLQKSCPQTPLGMNDSASMIPNDMFQTLLRMESKFDKYEKENEELKNHVMELRAHLEEFKVDRQKSSVLAGAVVSSLDDMSRSVNTLKTSKNGLNDSN